MIAKQNSLQNQISLTIYKPHRSFLCCTKYKDRSRFQNILQELELTEVQKQIIRVRYLDILENFQKRSRNYSVAFFIGRFIVTVGSLFVPALLSIQNPEQHTTNFTGPNFSVQVYWTTITLSLLVTIFNGILTLFKVDKKYYFLNTALERLRSEGWQYFSLTGRYSGHLIQHNTPTHSNQFVFFTHFIEKLKMKQVEEEYYKADEKAAQPPNGNTSTTSSGTGHDLYPPSPDQSIASIGNNVPEPVKEAVNSLIKSQSTVELYDNINNTYNQNNQNNRNNQNNQNNQNINKNIIINPEIDVKKYLSI